MNLNFIKKLICEKCEDIIIIIVKKRVVGSKCINNKILIWRRIVKNYVW